MTPEHALMNEVRERLGKLGWITLRINVGTFLSSDGRHVSTGGPKGFPDIMALKDGKAIFIETKIHPRKPTADQLRVIDALRKQGFKATVAYSVEDALKLVDF